MAYLIWQIGFNKCGSTSLKNFFTDNGIPSLHFMHHGNTLASIMHHNYHNNRPLLEGIPTEVRAFFDLEDISYAPPIYISLELLYEIDKQYPGSKYILNIRDKEKWLRSRCAHPYGSTSYLEQCAKQYKTSRAAILERWSREWDQHIAITKKHFAARPADLLVFDMENDSPEKLCAFFSDLPLNPSLFTHENQTRRPKIIL